MEKNQKSSLLDQKNIPPGLGKMLKEAREKQGLTQIEVAYKFGWHMSQEISNWELEKNLPAIYNVKKLSAVYKIPELSLRRKIVETLIYRLRVKWKV